MSLEKTIVDYSVSGVSPTTGNILLLTGASAQATLQPGIELLMIVVASAAHVRLGVGAQTAVITDPMVNPGSSGLVFKLNPELTYTLAVFPDNNANLGNVNYFRVYEG